MSWSDTPPTVAGTYWVKCLGTEFSATIRHDNGLWLDGHPVSGSELDGYQFGHRIPTNDELAQIDRERHALCEVATLCMNTRAIMPEFREISDYTEVVDVLGAFLERLGELPGLIEEYGEMRANLGTEDGIADAEPEMWESMLRTETKINAILGVADDAGAD